MRDRSITCWPQCLRRAAIAACAIFLAAPSGGALRVPITSAPELATARSSEPVGLGRWDDVVSIEDADLLVVRRGSELFRLRAAERPQPELLFSAPEIADSRIISGRRFGDRLWVFFDSKRRAPFALELATQTRIDFWIPGFEPGDALGTIQSIAAVPHLSAAIVMVSGGEAERWPRPGNRPVYFWAGLERGRADLLTIGWDLDYFSADQGLAVFATFAPERFKRRIRVGVAMKTGDRVGVGVPSQEEGPWVPRSWTNEGTDTLLLAPRRPETGAFDRVAGVSSRGRVVPLALPVEEPALSEVDVHGGWASFHLLGHGQPRRDDRSLWLAPMAPDATAVLVAEHVQDHENLGLGRCLLTTTPPDVTAWYGSAESALVFDASRRKVWDLLEGVERLPPIPEDDRGAADARTTLQVKLVGGFGPSNSGGRLGLAIVTERQFTEPKAIALDPSTFQSLGANEVGVPRATGRAARLPRGTLNVLLVTAQGARYETDLWQGNGTEADRPSVPKPADEIWLHNSGWVVFGTYRWSGTVQDRRRQIELVSQQLHWTAEAGRAMTSSPESVARATFARRSERELFSAYRSTQ